MRLTASNMKSSISLRSIVATLNTPPPLCGAPATSKRPERELKDRVHMLYEAVGFYKFRVTWENEPDWKARKHLVDMLYRPLLNRNNVRI